MVPVHSPATIFGTNIFFCSGLPCTISAAVAPMVRPPYIENAMLAELWNSVTTWLSVTGSPCPPYSAGADKPSQPPSATCLKASLKPFGVVTPAVVVAGAALEIADAVERLQHFFAEFGRLAQNRLPHIGGGIAEARKIVVAVDLEHVVEQEGDVFHGGFVDRHDVLPAGSDWSGTVYAKFSGAAIVECVDGNSASLVASCSPISRCSRLIALSGRTITLKWVIRPSSRER